MEFLQLSTKELGMLDIAGYYIVDMELTLVVSTFTYFYISTLLNWTF